MEKFLWKNKYKYSWWREKERIQLVKDTLKSAVPELPFKDIGFGGVKWGYTLWASKEKVMTWFKGYASKIFVLFGGNWKTMMRNTLWIWPDKIEYYRREKLDKSRVAHTCDREKKAFFIKIDVHTVYEGVDVNIYGTMEKMVVFAYHDKGVFFADRFYWYI